MNKDNQQNSSDSLKITDLPADIQEMLASLSEEDKKIVVAHLKVSHQQFTSFHGPIPPPSVLKGYKDIISDSPERILSMAEKQQKHRIDSERLIIKSQIFQNWAGLIFGAVIVVLFFVGAYKLALYGHDTVASIIVSTTIIAIASIFVLHKVFDRHQDEKS